MIPQSTPTPRYEMRRRLTLRLLAQHEPGTFLETGCGWGELLLPLVEMGYSGVAVEPSADSRAIATSRTDDVRDRVEVVQRIEEVADRTFDYLLSFEVLEHVEDDLGALRSWTAKLRTEGLAMLSVPAHMSRWSESDVAVGHYRRYDAEDILELISGSNLELLSLWTYGFPMTSITRRLRRPEDSGGRRGHDELSLASASVSHSLGKVTPSRERLLRLVGASADVLQRPFLRTSFGDGYYVVAQKL